MAKKKFVLTDENYYSNEAGKLYMSVSQYKEFAGCYGRTGCEFEAMERLNGNWETQPTTPMLVGSYVDSYFEGTLDKFKEEHPQIFTKQGTLKTDYLGAEKIIKRIEQDQLFMYYMSGKKQVIMTGELFGCEWKIKMDSYIEDSAFDEGKIVDLKTMRSIYDKNWVKDLGYLDFVRYWGYDIQGAVYQKIVEQNTGYKLPFYIAAATKENEPDIQVIHVSQAILDEALAMVEKNIGRVLEVKNGKAEPDRCEVCDCCKRTRVLTRPIELDEIISKIY